MCTWCRGPGKSPGAHFSASVLEEKVTIDIIPNANPPPNITVERMNGVPIHDKDTRITIGDDSIVLRSLNGSDVAKFIVQATNEAGVLMVTFSLSCEFYMTM